ncbi:MAG: hypothetical protein ACRC5M_03015 [Anaeroplasmataceae bacterium]
MKLVNISNHDINITINPTRIASITEEILSNHFLCTGTSTMTPRETIEYFFKENKREFNSKNIELDTFLENIKDIVAHSIHDLHKTLIKEIRAIRRISQPETYDLYFKCLSFDFADNYLNACYRMDSTSDLLKTTDRIYGRISMHKLKSLVETAHKNQQTIIAKAIIKFCMTKDLIDSKKLQYLFIDFSDYLITLLVDGVSYEFSTKKILGEVFNSMTIDGEVVDYSNAKDKLTELSLISEPEVQIPYKAIAEKINNATIEKMTHKIHDIEMRNAELESQKFEYNHSEKIEKSIMNMVKLTQDHTESLSEKITMIMENTDNKIDRITETFENTVNTLTQKVSNLTSKNIELNIYKDESKIYKKHYENETNKNAELISRNAILERENEKLKAIQNNQIKLANLMLNTNNSAYSIKAILDNKFYKGELHRAEVETSITNVRESILRKISTLIELSLNGGYIDDELNDIERLAKEFETLNKEVTKLPDIRFEKGLSLGGIINKVMNLGKHIAEDNVN